ncbi:MAG: PQQ-binding-like beta-propeller repeat protein [Planctomycetia bacterium]|nr:PQQ-binding-like beta-propeller repeat protein [Planctomycetia bacterium]
MRWLRSLLLLCVASTSVWAGDWPQWLGLNRDGASAEKVAPWKESPPIAWRQTVGEGFSVPIVAGGKVFIHARVAGKNEEEVVAFDAKTGKVLWRTGYGRAPYFSIINTGPQATPCVLKGRLYTYGITGVLTCLETENGKQLWQTDVFKKLNATLPKFGATSSPLVVGNRVLVAVGGKASAVAAFDTDSGEVAWQALEGPISTASPIVYLNRSKKGAAAVEAVFVNARSLVALNPFDGEVAWEHALSDMPLGTSPSPVVAGDLLLASSTKGGGVAVQLTHADDKTSTAEAWKNADLVGYFSTPVVCGKDHIYMVTTQVLPQPMATLRCVEVKTGKEAWKQPKVGFFHAGLVRTGDDKLLLLDDAGNLRLLEHDPNGYRELCKAQVCGSTFVTPALANGRLYVRDNKEVVCVELAP